MTTLELTTYASIVLSLVFSYVPSLSDWYAVQSATNKRLVMLAALVVVTLGAFGISCTPLAVTLGLTVACTTAGAYALIPAFVAAVIANQATFVISPERERYTALKAETQE